MIKLTAKQVLSAIVVLILFAVDTESEYKQQLSPVIWFTEWLILLAKLFIVAVALWRYSQMIRGERTLPLDISAPSFSRRDLAM